MTKKITFIVTIAICLMNCSHVPKTPKTPESEINEPTKLISESEAGHENDVKVLLEKGENPDQSNPQGVTSLMVAARKGYLTIVTQLLNAKADPNLTDQQGSAALHYAVLGSQAKVASLLLQNKASVDVKDGFNLTPLMLATRFANLATVKVLLEHGANINLKEEDDDWSALFFAIPRGDIDIFESLADRFSDLKQQDAEGDSLVAVAVQYKQLQILKKLIELRAPTDLLNLKHLTPIAIAIQNGDLSSVKELASPKDMNQPLPDGRTPLMLAIDQRQKEISRLLIALKADMEKKDLAGKSATDHLVDAGLETDWLFP
jgi:ankyrin repeat protein